jgi:hypothetical protein
LFGSLFVFTQYLQLVHGYSPLSAGVRALPFAFATGVMSPLSPVLAKRLGNRAVISAGLALMGLGLLDLSTAQVATGYPALALAVAIMGAGMGLVMAPASSTIMTTVPAHQASAGSAVNDTIREVGGTLGVAIVGSLAAAIYRSRLSTKLAAHHTPGFVAHVATSSIAAADAIGKSIGGARGGEIVQAARATFTTAMALGMRVAGGIAVAAALAAIAVIPRVRPARGATGGRRPVPPLRRRVGQTETVTDPSPYTTEIGFQPASELRRLLERGAITSVEIVEASLRRIAEADQAGPRLHAVLATCPDGMETAHKLDAERRQGKVRGALHGIPVLVKDNIDTAGVEGTTAGSLALAMTRPIKDAVVVQRLRAAGAIVIAKANLERLERHRWPVPQPPCAGPVARRFQLGIGRRCGCRARPDVSRYRDRRVHPLSGGSQWGRGDQADRRPHEPDRSGPGLVEPRLGRPDR